MNKTIIINIGGTIFHIEEDAYELLKSYMTEVKRGLYQSADSFEIVADIENRFAELFTQFLEVGRKQVLDRSDVKTVIDQLGKPSDFSLGEEHESSSGGNSDENKDEKSGHTAAQRRLFRDPDDKVIGGVCAGLSHFFDIDPVWVRLILGILFFVAGLGLIPYIIFWIAVPVAKTRADRIAMRGGVVNLESIRESVEKDIRNLSEKASSWGKEHINEGTGTRLREFFGEVFGALGRLIQALFKVAGGLIGALLLFVGSVTIISLFVSMIVLITRIHTDDFLQFPLNVIPAKDQLGTLVTAFFLILIPLIFLVILGVKLLFKKVQFNRPVVQSLAVVWFVSVGFGTYYGAKISSLYRHRAYISQEVSIKGNPKMIFRLKLDPEHAGVDTNHLDRQSVKELKEMASSTHRFRFGFGDDFVGDDFEGNPFMDVNISIEKSDSNRAYLRERFNASGPTYKQALKTAAEMNYPFKQVDSVLYLSDKNSLVGSTEFRGQESSVILYLPVGAVVWVDEETKSHIGGFEDTDGYEFTAQSKEVWTMTNNGLKPKYGVAKTRKTIEPPPPPPSPDSPDENIN